METDTKIGFLDSGIGGFTILKAVRALLPEYDYLYYGDTANLPYGNKTEEEVYTFTLHGVKELFSRGAGLVVVACNTASAETLRRIQDELIPHVYADKRILGVIIPTVETILASGAHNVLLIGTCRTVNSKKYDIELNAKNEKKPIKLTSIATPELVPFLESEKIDEAMMYLKNMIDTKLGEASTLVLGCTHYVLLKNRIRAAYPKLHVISQDEIIPESLKEYLTRHTEIESKLSTNRTLEIILTKDDSKYRDMLSEVANGLF